LKNHKTDVSSGEENVVNKNAEIVVPLLGDETSPETLVEIASSIKDGVKLNAINLIEAPNQTFLEAVNTHSQDQSRSKEES
jgi:hydroxymethylglutaryl-CoA reductase